MSQLSKSILTGLVAILVTVMIYASFASRSGPEIPDGREEVVFWHFWGGADRNIVEEVVRRFNTSQQQYFVRAIAMPGNNLDVKLFLSVTGGDPPDLINQDDPIIADWASRGALTPLSELASSQEMEQLSSWLFPAARRLGSYDERLYALCNGLDIRALYYNASLIEQKLGVDQLPDQLPNLERLDEIARQCTETDAQGRPTSLGYLPDPRRLWAWGVVFGGQFYDPRENRVTVDSPAIIAALEWMTSYRERYGAETVSAFRQGDQSLPGKIFPLLAKRYAIVMDGQWRCRDIAAAQAQEQAAGKPITRYGVWPLPRPAGSPVGADGWVNGNFFLVPRGARNRSGAWAFMKFWSGFGGNEAAAAVTCQAGGWIPASEQVVQQPSFQRYLAEQPLFARFVQLAAGNQIPTPVVPGASMFQRTVNEAVQRAMYLPAPPSAAKLLEQAEREIQQHLDRMSSRPVNSNEGSQPMRSHP